MMSLGSELKEAREAQGLSLDSLQETTKIQKRYLQAIEQEKFHILPGKFYARAFIKEYANAVGLDPNTLMEEHQDEIPSTEDEGTVQYTHMQRSRKDQGGQKSLKVFSVIPTIIVILLVIGIIFFAWYLTQQSDKDDNDPVNNSDNDDEYIQNSDENDNDSTEDQNNTNSNGANNDSEENENNSNSNDNENDDDANSDENNNDENDEEDEEEAEFSVVEEGTGTPPESELDFTYQGDDITLEMDAGEDTWLDIESESGESIYSDNLSPDDSPKEFDVSDEDKVNLNIGDASNLKVSINGEEMEYPVDKKKEVYQKIQINLVDDDE